jgi:hypothetical protein
LKHFLVTFILLLTAVMASADTNEWVIGKDPRLVPMSENSTDVAQQLDASGARGGWMFLSKGPGASQLVVLPDPAQVGMNVCVQIIRQTAAGSPFTLFGGVGPDVSDFIILDGVLLAAGKLAIVISGVDGDEICAVAISDDTWVITRYIGAWISS